MQLGRTQHAPTRKLSVTDTLAGLQCEVNRPTQSSASALSAFLSAPRHRCKSRSAFRHRSLAVFDLRVGHTMDVLSPFISVLCHSVIRRQRGFNKLRHRPAVNGLL